jgi:hypothetical protein
MKIKNLYNNLTKPLCTGGSADRVEGIIIETL